jgi:hypothetical protein
MVVPMIVAAIPKIVTKAVKTGCVPPNIRVIANLEKKMVFWEIVVSHPTIALLPVKLRLANVATPIWHAHLAA